MSRETEVSRHAVYRNEDVDYGTSDNVKAPLLGVLLLILTGFYPKYQEVPLLLQ